MTTHAHAHAHATGTIRAAIVATLTATLAATIAAHATRAHAAILPYATTQYGRQTARILDGQWIDGASLLANRQATADYEIDTTATAGRALDYSIGYTPIATTISETANHREEIPQPFPNPPIVETYQTTESITLDGLSGGGSFAASNWAPFGQDIFGEAVFSLPLAVDEGFTLTLTGTYRLTSTRGPTFETTFSYQLAPEIPDHTYARVSMGGVAKANLRYVTLTPTVTTLYDGTFDGIPYHATLLPLTVPVTVPEPHTLALVASIIGLGIARWRHARRPVR